MRLVSVVGGLCLILTGIFLPRDWYDGLPLNPALPAPPISGLTLLQLTFGVEGLMLLWVAAARPSFGAGIMPVAMPAAREAWEPISRRTAGWGLLAITLVGLALRLWRVDSDLWLDEMTPLRDYGHLSPVQVMATYHSSNNHLLNTILTKFSVASFGEHEWSVRLSAVLFGTATIPVFYSTARLVFTSANSLGAALLLAVSYHHIFFSQNARGYTAYILFSLLASTLLCKALSDGRRRAWALYIMTTCLNMASLLLSAFVFASHVVVAFGALLAIRRAGHAIGAVFKTVIVVFAVAAFLTFQLYAMVLPQAYVYMASVYTQAATGYALVSSDFVMEVLGGLLAGVGGRVSWRILPILLVGLGLGALGYLRLLARHWALTASLTLPGVLTVVALLLGGLTASPRFFLLTLPLAILVLVEAVSTLVHAAWRWWGPERHRDQGPLWLSLALIALVSALLLLPLRNYYEVPKQPYTASAAYLQSIRGPDDLVVVVHLAETGFRYYGPRFGLEEHTTCVYLRSKADLEAVMRTHTRGRLLLVTTFPRALRLEYPDLDTLIDQRWQVARLFPATIGDGEISIWTPR